MCADDLLKRIGAEIATMHLADVIHGDLTTSNMMLRLTPNSPSSPFEVVRLLGITLSANPTYMGTDGR